MRILIIFILAFLFSTSYAVTDTKRLAALTQEIRCVVCQNQNIADSNAPLANDLRTKISQMIAEQKSDEEIKDYLVKRYGEFILLKPRLHTSTLLLWTFPLLGIIGIFLFLVRFIAWPTQTK